MEIIYPLFNREIMIDLYKANGEKVELVEEHQLKERILKPILDSESLNAKHIEGYYCSTKTTGNQQEEIKKLFRSLASDQYDVTFNIHFQNDNRVLLIGYIYKYGTYGCMLVISYHAFQMFNLINNNITVKSLL